MEHSTLMAWIPGVIIMLISWGLFECVFWLIRATFRCYYCTDSLLVKIVLWLPITIMQVIAMFMILGAIKDFYQWLNKR